MTLSTLVPLLLTIIGATAAQDVALCNSTISRANASGITTNSIAIGENYTDVSWALTVDTRADGTPQSDIWYSTGGQNYGDDLELGYDVCVFFISYLPDNTNRLGQEASDSCEGMFTQRCLDTLLERAKDSALGYVRTYTPPPYSNLSAGVLPTLCSYTASDLSGEDETTWPHECLKEAGEDPEAEGGYVGARLTSMALTGYNESGLDDSCTLDAGSTSFSLADRISEDLTYDNATRSVWPILSVYFPVANSERVSAPGYALSFMNCLRVRDFAEGSRVSPTLPSGTPYSYGRKALSGGSIAGIVVGIVVLLGVLIGLAVLWIVRRRRKARAAEKSEIKEGVEPSGNELSGDEVYELKIEDRKPEMEEGGVFEMSPKDKQAELSADSQRHELQGSSGFNELSGSEAAKRE